MGEYDYVMRNTCNICCMEASIGEVSWLGHESTIQNCVSAHAWPALTLHLVRSLIPIILPRRSAQEVCPGVLPGD